MKKEEQKAIEKLIRVNVDANEGYRTAADNTNDTVLNTFFDSCALERKNYAEELLAQTGIHEVKSDLKADLHHAWINIKTARHQFQAKAVLKECARGEEYALKTYDKIIDKKEYPAVLHPVLESQRNGIASKYDQIKVFIDQYDSIDDARNRETPVP